jgi:hypothetical protein
MVKLVLATAITIASLAVSGSAFGAGGQVIVTGGWGCRDCGFLNGTSLTGIAPGSASTGAVDSVILPSGEILELR